MTEIDKFQAEVAENIHGIKEDHDVQALSRIWLREITRHKYAYNFTWMGRPIIQFPQDMIAMQEIIWRIRPDLIVETGIAHGGSLIYYASLLELLGDDGYILGIDIDVRSHNREAIEQHPMYGRIRMIEGSSVSDDVISQVADHVQGKQCVLVILDSNHTHDHVLQELNAYSSFVTRDSYMVVFDTLLELMPEDLVKDRAWGPGNNPMTAVREFLDATDSFEVDRNIESKLLITVAPGGYLKCTRD